MEKIQRRSINTKLSNVKLSGRGDKQPIIINMEGLEKVYEPGEPSETKALRGVNLQLSLGEIVVLFGVSGSGKSTLLNILAGLDEPTSGTIVVDGKNLAEMTEDERVEYHQYKIGMVFQSYNLIPTLTVMQNITMPARLVGFKRSDYKARGLDLLRQFQLEELANKLPTQCSGGQQQRVGIMRALINRPAFIVADEPTGNLDSVNSERIMTLLLNLNRDTNTTMIIVSHDPELHRIADRIVHILDGKVTKQTILTEKAKMYLDTIDVPVEVKLRKDNEKFVQKDGDGTEALKTSVEEKEKPKFAFALKKILAERKGLSSGTQHILSILPTLLTREQQKTFTVQEIHRLVEVIRDRVEGDIEQVEMQRLFDLPYADGGVGLYRQTAERLASDIEAVLLLGDMYMKEKQKKSRDKGDVVK